MIGQRLQQLAMSADRVITLPTSRGILALAYPGREGMDQNQAYSMAGSTHSIPTSAPGYSQLVLFEIKIFVNTLMLPLSPINEDPNNPSMHTKKNETCHIRTFITISTMLHPSGPLTGF